MDKVVIVVIDGGGNGRVWWRKRRGSGGKHRRGAIANVSEGWRTDTLETRAGRLRLVYRWGSRKPLVSWRTGQLLDHISKIVLVNIVNGGLMLLLRRRRGL